MRPKKTTLFVDDDEQALSIRKFLLETRGYRVLTAQSAEQALIRIEGCAPGGLDLIISDLLMPQIDGNELIRRANEIAPSVPTMLVSGSVKAFERGVTADAFCPRGRALRWNCWNASVCWLPASEVPKRPSCRRTPPPMGAAATALLPRMSPLRWPLEDDSRFN